MIILENFLKLIYFICTFLDILIFLINSISYFDSDIEKEASRILTEKEEESKKSDPNESVTWKNDEKEEEEKYSKTSERSTSGLNKTHPKGNKIHTADMIATPLNKNLYSNGI